MKKKFPSIGEDIKVMGSRNNDSINLTIAIAFISKFISSLDDYYEQKEKIRELVEKKFKTDGMQVVINTLDKGESIYLTVTGTSWENGDDGQVGRGNRANGIIPLNRPTCSEAAAGKNPTSHVGKIYNLLSYRIANQVYDKVPGIKEIYVWLLSQIGKPINNPEIASTQQILKPNVKMHEISDDVNEIIASEIENINEFCLELVEGSIPVC